MVKLITNGVASGLGFDNYDYKDVKNRSSEVKKYFTNKANEFLSFSDLKKIAETYPKPKSCPPHKTKTSTTQYPEIEQK